MDYSTARSGSKSLFPIYYRRLLLLLQVVLLLILFPSTIASDNDPCIGGCGRITREELDKPAFSSPYESRKASEDFHHHEATGKDQYCNCPPVRACPLEPKASEQLKENLASVIRHRLRDLLNKALMVEFATEAAHTIDLLKKLNASNSKLDRIRDNMYDAAQTLKFDLEEIPQCV